jgi:F-type H+-transporting ATPase subunit delta
MSKVASRYAKSLIELAIEQNALEAVHHDMQLFAKVCDENRAFTMMLRNPVISHFKKRDILTAVFGSKVHSLTAAIFDIITRKNREPLLPEIAKEFHKAYNKFNGIERATVTTVLPLELKQREEVSSLVQQISGKTEVELFETTDEEIIGGFLLTIEDRQIDATIKSKLKALQLKFSKNPYIKEF